MDNGRVYVGIDPGSMGFVAVMYSNGDKDFLSIKDAGYTGVVEFLKDVFVTSCGDVACCMEEVHAIMGSSAKSTFAFGRVNGVLIGILTALNIPYHLVQPKEWQGEIWINQDKEYKSRCSNGKSRRRVDTKKTSLNAGKRLFPQVDFRRTEKCKDDDDNKCDALLICEYGRRKGL